MPNEDAVSCRSDDGGQWAVAAVADGHGHALAVRADAGARLAVQIAVDAARSCCSDPLGDAADLPSVVAAGRVQVIVADAWSAAVEEDLERHPLSDDDLERSGDPGTVAAHPALTYGTTLLISFALGSSIVACQIGDGEIVAIARDGDVLRPLRADDRLVGTRTTSLASPSAASDFRGGLISDHRGIEVVVLATDGYVNSFSADDGFAAAGQDLWDLLHRRGPQLVEDQLAGWLESTSFEGTGDDASLAILYDRRAIPDGSPHARQQHNSADRGHR